MSGIVFDRSWYSGKSKVVQNLKEWEHVPCDICGMMGPSPIVARSNVQDTGMDLVKCPTCGLGWYQPRPTWDARIEAGFFTDEDARSVAKSHFEDGVLFSRDPVDGEKQKKMIWSYYKRILTRAEAYLPRPFTLFEVGCSVGWFMKVAQDEFGAECEGCDASPEAARYATQEFGLVVYPIAFHDMVFYSKYDCVAMFDFIEHSYWPTEDIRFASNLLDPKGLFMLKTFLEENDPDGTQVAPLHHTYHFTLPALRGIIERAGMEIVETSVEGAGQILLYAVKR